jgi:hypothetical protein
MNAARFLCALAATGAFAGCAGDISLNLDLPSTFLLETGNYELELNDRAGGATVAAAVPGEALVLELDIPAAEVVSVVPVVAEPGGWIVRIDVTDIPHQYELLIAAKVVTDLPIADFCTFAESLTSGGRVPCRMFVRAEGSG